MGVLSRVHLQQLSTHRASATISLFMPVQPTYAHLPDNLARLERLVQLAERFLEQRGTEPGIAHQMLEPFRQLSDHELFWCATGHGLAAFASTELFRAFRVPWRLPEQVRVGNRFCVAPLLPLLEAGGRFYILALQEESARLYEASEHSIQQISLPLKVPTEAESLTRLDITERGRKRRVMEFCHSVSYAVREVLSGQDAPLVLACVGYLAHLFQEHNRYEHLLKAKIPGNPRLWSIDELRMQAWNHVAPIFRQQKEFALRLYRDAIGSNRTAHDVEAIVAAADQGKIRLLLVSDGRLPFDALGSVNVLSTDNHQHTELGQVDADGRELNGELSSNGNGRAQFGEMLGHAVTQTLNHGGTVYRVEHMPGGHSPVAALLRP